jgi:putative ABC transport system permease protein
MLKNIIITSVRNFFRNKAFSMINLFGLAVSMSLSMLIILIIKEQFAFDNFHHESAQIYRVNTILHHPEWGTINSASTPLPVGNVLENEYSFSESVVKINRQLRADLTFDNVQVPVRGLFIDPSFFDVFNFPIKEGSLNAFKNGKSLVITSRASRKIFGEIAPVGQSVSLGQYGEYTITAVLEEMPGKTHLDFEILCSTEALPLLEKSGVVIPSVEDWSVFSDTYVYIKLKEGQSAEQLNRALAKVAGKHGKPTGSQGEKLVYEFYAQPLEEITPGPELSGQMGTGMPAAILIFLGVLSGIVLLMSIFNFTNLTVAKSLSRAREIGIRKVIGAKSYQIFVQFVGEAIVFSFIALAFAYIVLQFLKEGFLRLSLNEDFYLTLQEDSIVYAMFIGFAVLVGIVAGSLPAAYFSAFKPSRVLKDAQNLKISSRFTLRKVLMVTQLTLSIIFVITVLVVYKQVNFMLTADYGMDQKNNLNVRLQGISYRKIAHEIENLAGVVRVGGVSQRLGTFDGGSGQYKSEREQQAVSIQHFMVDDDYISNLSLHFVAGKNFDSNTQGQRETQIILNETALAVLGYKSAADALGHSVYASDSLPLQIIGVVKDFNFRPMNNRIGALALRYNIDALQYLSLKIDPSRKEAIIASLDQIFKKHDATHRLDYIMMEQEIDETYREAGMQDMLVMTGYAAFLIISLASLGMLGMAMYSTQLRSKEVGIRKVIGATTWDVLFLLTRSFLLLIGLAILIGVPLSYLLAKAFLQDFAYQVEVSPALLVSGVLGISVLGLGIVCTQTVRVALSNPAKWIRSE